jgi:hypothetical protein
MNPIIKMKWFAWEELNLPEYFINGKEIIHVFNLNDRHCGLLVRVPGYRPRAPGFEALPNFLRSSGSGTGPLSLLSTIDELLGRNSSCFSLESREYRRGDPSRWPLDTRYPQNLALTSPTSGGRSVGIVRSRAEATEFSLVSWQSVLNLSLGPIS